MKPNVQKEIDDLKGMVCRWYDFYLGCANGHRYDQYHVEEFNEVCNQQLSVYLQRLRDCRHINRYELGEFYSFIATKSHDLSVEIAKVKPEEPEDPIVTLIKNLGITDEQRKAVVKYLSGCGGNCEGCRHA